MKAYFIFAIALTVAYIIYYAVMIASSTIANLLNVSAVTDKSPTMSKSDATSNNCLQISIEQFFSPLKNGIPVV